MVGLFSRVYAQVTFKRLQVTEACPANLAGVWLLARVDQHMGAEMSDLKKPSKKEEKKNQLSLNNHVDETAFISKRRLIVESEGIVILKSIHRL